MTEANDPKSGGTASLNNNPLVTTETNPPDKKNSPNGLTALLITNATLTVWLVFLALGGGLLALYYSSIRYMPDIEWSSSIVYLAAASFIGGAVGLLFVLSLFLPGFIWATFMVADPKLTAVFCFDNGGKEPCVRSIWFHLGRPFIVVLFISHILLLVCSFGSATYFLVTAMAPLALSSLFMWLRFRRLLIAPHRMRKGEVTQTKAMIFQWLTFRWLRLKWLRIRQKSEVGDKRRKRRKGLERHRRLFKYTFWFGLSVWLSQISMLLVYRLSGGPTWGSFLVLTFICTVGVLSSALVVAERYCQRPGHAVIASLVIALVLLGAANRFSSLSTQIMALYGFGGEDNKFNILVNEEGIKIIAGLKLSACSHTVVDKAVVEELCGVKILSMVGNDYLLKLSDGRTFIVPKSAVISRDFRGSGQ